MYGSRFAAALSKALAARSSAELAGSAAISAVAVATVLAQQQQKEETHLQAHDNNSNKHSNSNSHTHPSPLSLPQTQCQHFASAAPPAPRQHFSRLARRRTIEKLQTTSTKTTLTSKYDVEPRPLGEGAFGAVYIARQRATLERVAIKKIPKQYTSDVNFQHEMEALMHIRLYGGHPNICGLRENFDEGSFYYLVLDLVVGGEMFDHLCNQGPYSEADAARLVREVASALNFCHGIGLVHGDLKPENLMLSSDNPLHATIKVVDFGCAQVTKDKDDLLEGETPSDGGQDARFQIGSSIANTPAYCPPEILDKNIRAKQGSENYNKLDPSFDMWALGVILYIMLTGVHPFDLEGEATDEEIERKVIARQTPPLRNSEVTAHLSESAIQLIEQLMQWDPEKRLSAHQMLNHPWVRGETARTGKIAGSDKKLSMYKAYKSKLEEKVFASLVNWSDKLLEGDAGGTEQVSLLERAFHTLDESKRGYITKSDLRRMSGYEIPATPTKTSFFQKMTQKNNKEDDDADQALDLSGFSELMGDNMKNRYFPKGHVVYREGDKGDQMFFINSGSIEVTTSDGFRSVRTQGDTFGEGALLNKNRRNTSTIRCKTPVHAIEISREIFDKYMSSEDKGAKINLSEKDRTRKRERAKRLLRLYPQLKELSIEDGDYAFREGDPSYDLYILEEGAADILVNGRKAFSIEPGEMCGEHATRYGRPRNSSALCVGGGEGCKFRTMTKEEYENVLSKNPWWVKKSLRDISLRRDFIKAITWKTGKDFPSSNDERMREVFDSADLNKSGKLEMDNIREMLHSFDTSFTDKDVKEILDALDLDESGAVSFAEFKRMFSLVNRKTKPKNLNVS